MLLGLPSTGRLASTEASNMNYTVPILLYGVTDSFSFGNCYLPETAKQSKILIQLSTCAGKQFLVISPLFQGQINYEHITLSRIQNRLEVYMMFMLVYNNRFVFYMITL